MQLSGFLLHLPQNAQQMSAVPLIGSEDQSPVHNLGTLRFRPGLELGSDQIISSWFVEDRTFQGFEPHLLAFISRWFPHVTVWNVALRL